MRRADVLELYDAEMRRDPPLVGGSVLDRSGGLVRMLGERSWIGYWTFTSHTARQVVEAQAAEFRRRGTEVEWKLYSHDGPPGLDQLLAESGFKADPPETLMALDLRNQPLDPGPIPGIRIERVSDPEGLREAVAVSTAAFSPDEGWEVKDFLPRLSDPTFAVYLARSNGVAVSAGRLELTEGKSFASIWGGGTLPESRGRGIYGGLVRARADLARSNGYRYLTVDARETSRPILEHVGFEPLSGIVGWVLRP